jgi:hypothetical protein
MDLFIRSSIEFSIYGFSRPKAALRDELPAFDASHSNNARQFRRRGDTVKYDM